jgi:FtsP/CotA-like multicopper oxidase with cupredoxin domain
LENGETDKVDGDVIHVNSMRVFEPHAGILLTLPDQPWPYLEVEPRQYRFRILNVGISRDYVFSFVCDDSENEIEFSVVGADSGLLRYPVKTTTLGSAVAERYEVVLDFSDFKGQNITMKNAQNLPGVDDFTHTDKIMRKCLEWNWYQYQHAHDDLQASSLATP